MMDLMTGMVVSLAAHWDQLQVLLVFIRSIDSLFVLEMEHFKELSNVMIEI
jgi:hypothetical protein